VSVCLSVRVYPQEKQELHRRGGGGDRWKCTISERETGREGERGISRGRENAESVWLHTSVLFIGICFLLSVAHTHRRLDNTLDTLFQGLQDTTLFQALHADSE
jgi:hypothetical protein